MLGCCSLVLGVFGVLPVVVRVFLMLLVFWGVLDVLGCCTGVIRPAVSQNPAQYKTQNISPFLLSAPL